eukprot:12630547-Alexandrium_andersonii.AAC.1
MAGGSRRGVLERGLQLFLVAEFGELQEAGAGAPASDDLGQPNARGRPRVPAHLPPGVVLAHQQLLGQAVRDPTRGTLEVPVEVALREPRTFGASRSAPSVSRGRSATGAPAGLPEPARPRAAGWPRG